MPGPRGDRREVRDSERKAETERPGKAETETEEESHLFIDSTFIEHLAIAGTGAGQCRWMQMVGTEIQQHRQKLRQRRGERERQTKTGSELRTVLRASETKGRLQAEKAGPGDLSDLPLQGGSPSSAPPPAAWPPSPQPQLLLAGSGGASDY